MKKIILLFTLVLCLLISCKKKDGCIGEKKPGFCPDNIDYVCGCDGKTYSNGCVAESEGVLSYTKGECKKKWWKRK